MKKIVLTAIIIGILSATSGVALAQEIGLGINPPIAEIVARPNSTINLSYQIENRHDPAIIEMTVVNVTPSGQAGSLSISQNLNSPILFEFTLSGKEQASFFMASKSKTKVNLTIKIPQTIDPKDYYVAVNARAINSKTSDSESSVLIEPVISSPLLISIPDKEGFEALAQLEKFSIEPRFKFNLNGRVINIIDSTDSLPISLIVKNNGRHLIKPQGSINLTQRFKKQTSYPLLPVSILKSSSRLIPAVSIKSCEKNCQPNSLIISGFLLGKYDLVADVNFGLESTRIHRSTSFYALPLKLIIAILLGLILIYYLQHSTQSH